jgi:hypothetical protein
MKKGQKLGLTKTKGLIKGAYDLYEITGLSLGKLALIAGWLKLRADAGNVLAEEILQSLGEIPYTQTISE